MRFKSDNGCDKTDSITVELDESVWYTFLKIEKEGNYQRVIRIVKRLRKKKEKQHPSISAKMPLSRATVEPKQAN